MINKREQVLVIGLARVELDDSLGGSNVALELLGERQEDIDERMRQFLCWGFEPAFDFESDHQTLLVTSCRGRNGVGGGKGFGTKMPEIQSPSSSRHELPPEKKLAFVRLRVLTTINMSFVDDERRWSKERRANLDPARVMLNNER